LGTGLRGDLVEVDIRRRLGGRIPGMAWHTLKEYIRINELVYSRVLPSGPIDEPYALLYHGSVHALRSYVQRHLCSGRLRLGSRLGSGMAQV
jgi:hypothetical protein